MGFSNPVVNETGALIRSAIHSPNFVHGVSGWSINKDGTAEFHSVIIPSTGGVSVYFQATPPVGANTGDLWYDTSNGLLLHQWSGSAWTAFQIGTGAISNNAITGALIQGGAVNTAQIANNAITNALMAASAVGAANIQSGVITATQIANAAGILGSQLANGTITATQIQAGTITAALIAAGVVVSGIVDGTEVIGATIVADGVSGQFLIYSGTPAFGNLIGSWSGAAGTDAFGNTYPAGLSVVQGAITGLLIDGTTIVNSTFQGGNITSPNISNPTISGGSITETSFTLDTTGGSILAYTSSTTTTTFAASGITTFTAPASITQAKVECWGAGAGGGGGNAAQGGEGGGGGEYAQEPSYPLVPGNVYNVVVGNGGPGGITGQAGADGSDTSFDSLGVVANGGSNGASFVGGAGGSGSTNTIHHNGGTGGNGGAALGGNTGGGGGGSSAGTGANGNAGTASSGATGKAGGAAPVGGSAGGTGGSNAANGVAGSAPGGGGGGAGSGSSANSGSNDYDATSQASYYGSDASVSPANGRRNTTGPLYQGQYSGGGGQGHQYSYSHFPGATIVSDLAGKTLTDVKLTVHNEHSWYSSGMTLEIGTANTNGVYPSTGPIAGDTNNRKQISIAEGATKVFSIGTTIGNEFKAGTIDSIKFGPAFFDLNYYGYNSATQMHIKFIWTSGAGSTAAGAGADGQVKITYQTAQTLLFSVSPVAFTDKFGNAIPAGVYFYNTAAPAAQAGAFGLHSASGQPEYVNPAGLTMKLPGAQLATFPGTVITQAVATAMGSFTIPAGDAQAGTGYEIEIEGAGTWGSTAQALTFAGTFGGVAITSVTIGAAAFAISNAIRFCVRVRVWCHVTGATATWHSEIEGYISGIGSLTGAPGSSVASLGFITSENAAGTFTRDSTIANTFTATAAWAATTGAPTITVKRLTNRRLV